MEEQNDHELEEFCFRCSAKNPCYDAPVREPLHNPWPLLARSDQPEYMRSQPVVRMVYSPIPLPAVFDTNERYKHMPANPAQLSTVARADFVTWFNALHEGGHLFSLDWTPIKELAKLCQAGIYTAIQQLLFQPRLRTSRIELLWMRFNGYSRKFGEIAKNIGFVEELVATANAITALEEHIQSGRAWAGFQDELEACKEAALQQEEEVFSDFQATYARFAPLMRLMYRNPALRSYVMPLLQPVRLYKESGLDHVDGIKNSQENLQTILSLIEGIDSANEVRQRLQPLYQEMLSGWHIVLVPYVIGMGDMQGTPEEGDLKEWIVQLLWRITRGDIVGGPVESVEGVVEQVTLMIEQIRQRINTGRPVGSAVLAGLSPATDKGQTLIGMNLQKFGTVDITDTLSEDILNVIFFEGLRQQLRRRKGIVCPLSCCFHVFDCRCGERRYKAVKRLSKLAKDGAFGPGEWSLLPCKR